MLFKAFVNTLKDFSIWYFMYNVCVWRIMMPAEGAPKSWRILECNSFAALQKVIKLHYLELIIFDFTCICFWHYPSSRDAAGKTSSIWTFLAFVVPERVALTSE